MHARSLAAGVLVACTFPRLVMAQTTPPAPVTSLSATTVSQSAINLTWTPGVTPTPALPGTISVYFSGAPTNFAADVTITGNGSVSGIDAANGATNDAIAFDSAIQFGSGNSTFTLTENGKGTLRGSGSVAGVTGVGLASVRTPLAPVFLALAALRPGTTFAGGLKLSGSNSITSGGPLLVEGPLSVTGSGSIGSPSDSMIVIVRPTSTTQLQNLVSLTGKGSIYVSTRWPRFGAARLRTAA